MKHMNTHVVIGEVVRVFQNRETLNFTVAVENKNEDKTYTDYVPCVYFKPSDELKAAMVKGKTVGFQGRVRDSKYESGGDTRYRCQSVVMTGTLCFLD